MTTSDLTPSAPRPTPSRISHRVAEPDANLSRPGEPADPEFDPNATTDVPGERTIRLGTRSSALALTQSETVAEALRQLGLTVEIVPIHTQGDVNPASLTSLGGIGVFAAALRLALLAGDCDVAVHSFKDLPTASVPGLTIGAVPPRADCADVLICRDELTLETLPPGARVGTGSPRRAASVLALRPDLEIVDIRGNVGTRLGRVAGIDPAGAGDLDAVVLARAGLARLGSRWANAPTLPALPAPAQGALAVEIREDDEELLTALARLDDADTRACVFAERAVLEGLQAGCAAPVGAHASIVDGDLALTGRVLSLDGAREVELTSACPLNTVVDSANEGSETASENDSTARPVDRLARELGLELARALIDAGAREVADLSATKPLRVSHEPPPSGNSSTATDSGRTAQQKGSLAMGASTDTSPPIEIDADSNRMRWGSDGPQLNIDRNAKPLVGRTVFLPREINDHLTAALTEAGAHVHAHPLTRTVLGDMFHVKHALAEIERGSYTWIIITSARTIKALAAAAAGETYSEHPDYAPLRAIIQRAVAAGTQFAALGRKTADACDSVGATPAVSVEKHATAEDLLAAFTSGPACQYNARALIPASALARSVLADGLAHQGWVVDRVAAYTTEPLDDLPAHIGAGWQAGLFDAVVFTAGSNARAAVELLGVPAASTRVITFGKPSAHVAAEVGLHVDAVAPTQNAEGIIAALQVALNDKE